MSYEPPGQPPYTEPPAQPYPGQPWPPQQGGQQPYPQQAYPGQPHPGQPYPETWPPQQGGQYGAPPVMPRRAGNGQRSARPRKRRHWVRNTLLGLAGVIVLIIALSIAANRGGNGTSTAGSGAPANAGAAAPQAARIGTPVRDGKFQFTITSVSYAKSVGDTADGLGDTAQGEYTILHVTVTNIGNQPQTLDDSSQYVYDASGRRYDASTNADVDLNSASGSDSVLLNDINPGNTVRGELAFDMPAGVKAVKAELHDSAFSGGVTVILTR